MAFCRRQACPSPPKIPVSRDFPGDLVVKNLPANAGDTVRSMAPGTIPHLAGQESLCATTTEAPTPRACALQQKPVHRNDEQLPLATTRESLRAAMNTQHNQKNTIAMSRMNSG